MLDVKSALEDALKEGKTLHQFKTELTPILQKKGWWGKGETINPKTGEKELVQLGSPRRLKTIYDANKRSARASATWQRAQATKKFAPYFIYELGPSQKHREEHKGWQGKIRPIDDPFWNYAMPPNGWGCKCFVTQITKAMAEKLGGVSPHLPLEFKSKTINGVEIKYLKGVDVAWSSNSGKFRNKVLSETLENKLLKSPKTMATSQIQSIVASNYFKVFFEKSKQIQESVKGIPDRAYNFVPIAYVDVGIVKEPKVLKLSEETLANKKLVHADIGINEYKMVQDIVSTGTYNKSKQVYYKKINGKYYLVSVKITKNNELIMTSFYRITEAQVKDMNK